MYKILKADADTYVTSRVVNGERVYNANVGAAGSLDLFKLYGQTMSGSTPNIELSRLLIHFDLQSIVNLVSNNKIDYADSSFRASIKLFDVYGGQPTPKKFSVLTAPLVNPFDEGSGRDVVLYGDNDVANFLSSSIDTSWVMSGAGLLGTGSANCDALLRVGADIDVASTTQFVTGEEDLVSNVTNAVGFVLSGFLTNNGFRISFSPELEENNLSYFVKRFASRTAYNADKHPQLIIQFDDSIQDDSNLLTFDTPCNLFLYNYVQGTLQNLVSASLDITGSASLVLDLQVQVSGGFYDVMSFGGQHAIGSVNKFPDVGVYMAQVTIPSDVPEINAVLAQSGSVKFTPIWRSLDNTVTFLTGNPIFLYPPTRGSSIQEPRKLLVNVTGLKPEFDITESTILRVNIFDQTSPTLFKTKTPLEAPGIVIRDVFYSIRDKVTNLRIVPFDTQYFSTRVSSDSKGMHFRLDVSNLTPGRSYVVDIMVSSNGNEQTFSDASPPFRVIDRE